MTRDEIMGLSGRELDKVVALSLFGPVVWSTDGMFLLFADGQSWRGSVPHYSTDHNAARLVLAEVERRDVSCPFMRDLFRLLFGESEMGWIDTASIDWKQGLGILNATPTQICQAALLAVEGV